MALFLSACALALQAASAAASGNADPTVPPITPSPARDEAVDIVSRLSPDEKYSILNGIGYAQGAYHNLDGWYVGNTPAVGRLNIPNLNLQDAAQGFRTTDPRMIGEVE